MSDDLVIKKAVMECLDSYFAHFKRIAEPPPHQCMNRGIIDHHGNLLERIDIKFDNKLDEQREILHELSEKITNFNSQADLDKKKLDIDNNEILRKLDSIHGDLKEKGDLISKNGGRITKLEIDIVNLTFNVESNIKKLQSSLNQIDEISDKETVSMIQAIKNTFKVSKSMAVIVGMIITFVTGACTFVLNIDSIYKLIKGNKDKTTSSNKIEEKKPDDKQETKK